MTRRVHRLGLAALLLAAASASGAAPGGPAVEAACIEYAQRLGSVYPGDCFGKPFVFTGHRSVQGKPILLREFRPGDPAQTRGRVLVVGGIHGDELSSISIVFSWLRELDAEREHAYHWRLTPSMNPDGLFRRDAQRMNAHGVDLNRNFPTPNWDEASRHYWVNRTRRNPRRYPGPAPLSEPESKWLYQEIERFRPHAIVAIHAPYGIVDFDGPSNPPRKLGHLHLNLLGTYPGSLGNFAGVQRGIPVVTVELPSAGIMPTARQQDRIWADLKRWLEKHIPTPEQERAQLSPESR